MTYEQVKEDVSRSYGRNFRVCWVGVAESVAVSAANCGDVNNDGIISLSDLVALTKYLDGIYELVDYSVADTNANYIVDYVDSLILNAYIVESIPSLPYTG